METLIGLLIAAIIIASLFVVAMCKSAAKKQPEQPVKRVCNCEKWQDDEGNEY